MKIHLETPCPDGLKHLETAEFDAVPRVGEDVYLTGPTYGGHEGQGQYDHTTQFVVERVFWEVDDGEATPNVVLILGSEHRADFNPVCTCEPGPNVRRRRDPGLCDDCGCRWPPRRVDPPSAGG